MKTEIKILKKLLENKNKEFTIREISNLINSDYKIVYLATKKLTEKKLLAKKTLGGSTIINLKPVFSKDTFLAELERREEILKNKNILILLDLIKKEIKSVNYFFLLFGSYSKKSQNKKSDIDLLFVSDNLKEKDLEAIFSLVPFKVDFHLFSEKEFLKMKNSSEMNLIKEAIENNVILYGIEQYYGALEK